MIVVGGGPAGLAAGMHLSRAGYRTLLLEKEALGGQAGRLRRIENYPGFPSGVGGARLAARFAAHARGWGLRTRLAEVAAVERGARRFRVTLAQGRALTCRAVVCCAGGRPKRARLPAAKRFLGLGVHEGPVQDAPRARRKTVAVVGGGEAAVHEALLLSRYARRVHLLSRAPALRAHRLLRRRLARRLNVSYRPNTVVEGLEGRARLDRLLLRDTATGRRERLEASELFFLIGKSPSALLDGNLRQPGFFAAGDASGGLCRQVVVAAGRGVEAAARCIAYLEGWRTPRANRR